MSSTPENLDVDLLARLQKYVATDYNNQIPVGESRGFLARPESVIISTFSRVLDNWKCFATIIGDDTVRYKFVHNWTTGVTMVTVYYQRRAKEVIL